MITSILIMKIVITLFRNWKQGFEILISYLPWMSPSPTLLWSAESAMSFQATKYKRQDCIRHYPKIGIFIYHLLLHHSRLIYVSFITIQSHGCENI